MVDESPKYPLVEAAIKRSRLPRLWTIVIIAGVLSVLLILMAYLDGESANLLVLDFWRVNLANLGLIIYILSIYPLLTRLRGEAIQSFKLLLPLEDKAFNLLVTEISRPNRRGEWTAVFLGISVGLGIGQPWNLDWVSGYFWIYIYQTIVAVTMVGLLSWLIYDILAGIVHISRLARQDLKLNILDIEMLTPVAAWGLGISFVFVGGISLTWIFKKYDVILVWDNLITYGVIVCVTALIFFVSMWSAHRAITKAKERELEQTRKQLVTASYELKGQAAQSQLSEMQTLASTVASLTTYYKLIQEAPTWPFTAGIVRRLIASTAVPIIVYAIKILSGVGLRF